MVAPKIGGLATAVTFTWAATDENAALYFEFIEIADAQDLTPSLFGNGHTFFGPTITTGVVDLTPGLFANDNTFFGPTITTGVVDLTPSLFANGNTFFGPTITVGLVDLTPSLFANQNTFFSPTITTGVVDLTPSLFANGNTFYAPTAAIPAAFDVEDAARRVKAKDYKAIRMNENRVPQIGWEGKVMPYELKEQDVLDAKRRRAEERAIEEQVKAFRANLKKESTLR